MSPSLHALVARLWCLHWPGPRAPGGPAAALRSAGVVLDTCLRRLAFGIGPRPVLAPGDDGGAGGELSTGWAAYRFLLEVATGLQSAVPGETNVFGQFRRAWDEAARTLPATERALLGPVVEALRADTRALRATHLQGIAGGSYGSLARELLAPRRDARVLFVGSGELALSMLPLFRAFDVGAWNHRAPAFRAGWPPASACRRFDSDAADAAAAWATDLVFTTPADPAHDAAWRHRLGRTTPRRLVHLGERRADGPCWPGVAARFDLDDVFDLAATRELHRRRQLAAAARALAELVEARLAGPRPAACSA